MEREKSFFKKMGSPSLQSLAGRVNNSLSSRKLFKMGLGSPTVATTVNPTVEASHLNIMNIADQNY